MHRRWNLSLGGPRQGAVPVQTGTRWRQLYACGMAFVAGGKGRAAALVLLCPSANEARPLPGSPQGNGGRCDPHSSDSFLNSNPGFNRGRRTGAASLNWDDALGTGFDLVNESAQPDIHY